MPTLLDEGAGSAAPGRHRARQAGSRRGRAAAGGMIARDRERPQAGAPLATLVEEVGYGPDEPLVVAVAESGAEPLVRAQGVTSAGDPVTGATLIYTASLSKQFTAACAAVLVQRGGLDMASTLSRWLPELPAWAASVRLCHLVHHTAALPADEDVDATIARAGTDRTSAAVLDALGQRATLVGRPGTEHSYSNAGYVCLAVAVERAAGRPLQEFARDHLFGPVEMADTSFWAGPGRGPPGAAALSPPTPAPLSLGDGGVWSTPADLLRWSGALNADQLGNAALLQTPGTLADGTTVQYAWGMAVRSFGGHRVYRHGGGWTGLRVLQARIPALGLSVVFAALADETERRVALVERILDLFARPSTA